MLALRIATFGLTAALAVLVAIWMLRWRGFIDDSLVLRYRSKAKAAEHDGDQDWAVRCQNRAHEAKASGFARCTDVIPAGPPPCALWLLLVAFGVASGLLALR